MYQLVKLPLENGKVVSPGSCINVLQSDSLSDLESVLKQTMQARGKSTDLTYSSELLDASGVSYWYASHDTIDNAILAVVETRNGDR